MFFWQCVAIIIAAAIKKTEAIEITVVSDHIMLIKNIVSWKKKKDFHMFFFPFLYSATPNLDLGILKMLICECYNYNYVIHTLQLAVY